MLHYNFTQCVCTGHTGAGHSPSVYVLSTLDGIYHDQYKTRTSLSSFNNLVYYCNTNDCINHVKNIISEWIKAMVHQR